jgi:perosamine synthetase
MAVLADAALGSIISFIRDLYPGENPVPLHAPRFLGREKEYLARCIDTTYVSYVGEFVTRFEEHVRRVTGAAHAVALVNGTAALHMALQACGVGQGDAVVTQSLTFVATANAISHCGALPLFVDIDRSTLGMSPERLEAYFAGSTVQTAGGCHDRATGRRVAACVPMHTFGHPAEIQSIVEVCARRGVAVVEDAAESLGSLYRGRHTGRFGAAAILSFNGNKIVTTGGGGMLITEDAALAARVRHLSTTAKAAHPWEFRHDAVGWNLRLPNLNAAVGCAQMERLEQSVENKRDTAERYGRFFAAAGIPFLSEREGCRANYWLNAILLEDREARDDFLARSNAAGVCTRPAWNRMTSLPMYAAGARDAEEDARWIEDHLVNIPSSVRTGT